METRIILSVLFISFSLITTGENPVIRGIGMSDPHVRVFKDTIYLFSGHDDSPEDKTWVMKDWYVFSTTDLIHWKQETTISPKDNYMGEGSTDCWAGDAATRNGKYFFYFSDRKRSIGVMTSDSPGGRYIDAIGKPLVAPMHDPTILVDDDKDKTAYLVYGDKEGGGYNIARLNEDMISLAELPKHLVINGEEWQKAPGWLDKNYIFKHNGTYYLTWGSDYAISKNIYGPYQCVGAVGSGHHLDGFAHGSFFWWKGQFYHIWTYYLRPGFKYRECIITYCHFSDDGRIVNDTGFLDQHYSAGVGQFDASWPEIQAEWFTEKSEGIKKQGTRETGFKLGNLADGSWVKFANMDFGDKNKEQKFEASLSAISGIGTIEIRLDSLKGKVLGTVSVSSVKGIGSAVPAACQIGRVTGKKDVYLLFSIKKVGSFNIDSFRFISEK